MSFTQIEITSNSTPVSIKNDFQSNQAFLKLQISFEIQVDQEEIILDSVAEQLQSLIHLDELCIVVQKQCILEQFHILTEGLAQLVNLKVFSISFSEHCLAGEIYFQHLCSSIQRMTQLTVLRVCAERNNALNQRSIQLLNESLSHLKGLLKLKIQISEGNQFDDQMAEELAKGLNQISEIQELELQLDCAYISQNGMIAIGNSLKDLNKTLCNLKIVLEGHCKYQGLSNIFQSLPYLSHLKILEIVVFQEINIEQKEVKNIVESFSKLINLEQLVLNVEFPGIYFHEYVQLITQLSHFKMLKRLDLNIFDFNKTSLEIFEQLQEAFSSLSTLEKLKLVIRDYQWNKEACFISLLANSFEKMNQLTSLQLKLYCRVNKIDSIIIVKSIKHLKNLENLQLDLGIDFYIDQETLDYLGESLQSSTNLKYLHLFLNAFCSPELLSLNKLNLNLMNLKNLQELIINKSQNLRIQGQDILIQLKSLERLEKLELGYLNIDEEAAHSFSSAFANLNQLTDLTLSINYSKSLLESDIILKFDFFCFLSNLRYLNLSLNLIIGNDESQSLGQSLLSLKNLTTVKLESGFQSLSCLQNILKGFSNSKLKNLKLVIIDMEDIPEANEDLKLFSSVQFLENISVKGIDIQKDDSNTKILINSLKELLSLKKINVVLEKPETPQFQKLDNWDFQSKIPLNQNYQILIQLIQFFPNLIEFEISNLLKRKSISSKGFDLIQQQEKALKIREISLDIFFGEIQNHKLNSLMKQLKNLRQLVLHIKFITDLYCKNLHKKPLLIEIPRFLTELELTISTKQKYLFTYYNLGEELRMIKHLKYLTDLSFLIRFEDFDMTDLIHFGQSLQQIDQIRNLTLEFNLRGQYSPQTFVELSKGISQQRFLQRLSIQIIESKGTSFSYNIMSIIESFKELIYLQNLSSDLSQCKRSENQVSSCNDILVRLGQNLSNLNNLRKLDIKLNKENIQNVDEGISFFANALQSNFSLLDLKFSIEGVNIDENAARALGKGLSYLKQLKQCSLGFQKSEIDDCSGILEGINNIEGLKSFLLCDCYVKRLSFTPLHQILFSKQGTLNIDLSDNNDYGIKRFDIKFENEQTIFIQQSSKSILSVNEHLKLTRFMANISSSIDIDLKLYNNNIFSDSDDSKLLLELMLPLSISKLSLEIKKNNINHFEKTILKMKQVKELDIYFKENVNNYQIVTVLKNLSNSIQNIFQLYINLTVNSMNDNHKINDLITAIKQYKSINTFILSDYSSYMIYNAFINGRIQRKLTQLTILSINNFKIKDYLYYQLKQNQEMDEEEDVDEEEMNEGFSEEEEVEEEMNEGFSEGEEDLDEYSLN